jgi:hypothetical protein
VRNSHPGERGDARIGLGGREEADSYAGFFASRIFFGWRDGERGGESSVLLKRITQGRMSREEHSELQKGSGWGLEVGPAWQWQVGAGFGGPSCSGDSIIM